MYESKGIFSAFKFIFLFLIFPGCATSPMVTSVPVPQVPGTYHRMEKGQTLWRISKDYGVDLDEILRANNILDVTNIEVGQQILIPTSAPLGNKPAAARHYSEDFIWPLKGEVAVNFGRVFNHMLNKGINIRPRGNRDVVCARSGKVVFSSENFSAYGKTIIIDHDEGLSSVYAGNSETFVKTGDSVQKGAVIARIGKGNNDFLHFQIRKGHVPKNPLFYLP